MVSGPFPASSALVLVSMWRNEVGHVVSTIVGKVSIDPLTRALVLPEAIVSRDVSARDPSFVTEANEAVPFTDAPSILLVGGPQRFTLATGGAPKVASSASEHAPAGYSTASPERAVFTPEAPTTGIDGVATIPDDLDGRYFMAAPSRHHLAALRGDEQFAWEHRGTYTEGQLPGVTIVATVRGDKSLRAVALDLDMVVVDANKRRVSLVGRAILHGPVTLLSHAVLASNEAVAVDRGDPRPRMGPPPPRAARRTDIWPFAIAGAPGNLPFDDSSPARQTMTMDSVRGLMPTVVDEQTADLSRAELSSATRSSMPFGKGARESESTLVVAQVPATPFDQGFAPTHVIPAADVISTLTPDDAMAKKLLQMRAELRRKDQPPSASPPPVSPLPRTKPR